MKNSEFIIDRVPITKEEVRAICISKLNLSMGKIMLDIGSGSGSISVESAYNNPDLMVYSIERDDRAFELTGKNIEKFNLTNIVQIKAYAPCDMGIYGIEKDIVDSVFLGGSGKKTDEILEWSYSLLKKGGILVGNFILIENINLVYKKMMELGFKDIEVVQVSISKMEKLGSGHYFKPENPIFVISAKK